MDKVRRTVALPDFDAERHLFERRAALPLGLCWLVLSPLLGLALLRLVAHDAAFPLIVLNAMTTWVYLPAWLTLAVALWWRRRNLALASTAVVLLHVLWVNPLSWLPSAAPPLKPSSQRFVVMSVNLLMVNDDTEGIASEIAQAHPDLLLVQEVSPLWAERFDAPDMRRLFPQRHVIARSDSFGIGVLSPHALEIEELQLSGLPALRGHVALGKRRLELINVHTLPPRTAAYTEEWNEMMRRVCQLVEHGPKPLVLAGDLNATPHARWYRELLSRGLRGAHEERGRGYATTWPNGLFPFPPIRLDHFLVSSGVGVISVTEGEGRGSDHRPIVAELSLD